MEEADDDIAVVGIGCNFPGGEGLENFWRVLLEGRNCVVDIPPERFDTSRWYDPDENKPGKTQTSRAALIDGFNELDHRFFGISEAEADVMDPQQKLLLQCTYRALEDAGIPMETISGSTTGVYIGLMNRDYEMLRSNSPTSISHYNGTGTAMSVAASRISFTFNLTGPSFAIDSACSSSLVALHLACQAIKRGDCHMALCGGVSCILEPRVFVALSKAKMISADGTSKPFSSRADGYGRGEGCGVLLLKRLTEAERDCNKVWGVISKTAINQDGRSVTPITKPSLLRQEELLRGIYSESDLTNVQYIEAHGTGTPVGDPTEAASISNVIAKARPPGSDALRIGCVKGNIGHTESAAGVAGLIKVLLMMKHQTVVPTVFYSRDTSSVDVEALGVRIPTEAESWRTRGSSRRIAGVNSFGFGGTNAHVIVREHGHTAVPAQVANTPKCFVVSAASEESLSQTIADTHRSLCLDRTVDLRALSYTSACRRTHSKHKYRRAMPIGSLSDLQQQLTSNAPVEPTRSNLQVVFVFSGNGVAFSGMCGRLFRDVPVFKDTVRQVEELFQTYKSVDIGRRLSGDGDRDDVRLPDVVQPCLFAVQVAIATVLKQWGIRPHAVLGHSLGEVAAAHCSGLLSLADAVKVVHHRSALQSEVARGKMLVVSGVSVEKVLGVVHSVISGRVCVAAFNSPRSCTLSGDAGAVDALGEKLKVMFVEENVFLHVLDVPAAYHSHIMDPIVRDVERSIGFLSVGDVECQLFSTVTGDRCSHGDFSTGAYWARNIREAVLFEQTLRAVTKHTQPKGNLVFVEVGPRRALLRNIRETVGNSAVVLSSVLPGNEYETIVSTVAKLFELGVDVRWHELYRGCRTPPTALPVYHFHNAKKDVCFEAVRKGDGTLLEPGDQDHVCDLSVESAPFLWEHKNHGVPIVPGAFYVEAAYAAVMARVKPPPPVSSLRLSVTFHSLSTLSSNRHQLRVTLAGEGTFKIDSAVATHASGTYTCTGGRDWSEERAICLDAIWKRCKTVLRRSQIYSALSQAGFEYGSVFKQLDDVRFGGEFREAVTSITVPAELMNHMHDYVIHPVLLDCFLQMTAAVAMGCLTARHAFPSAIGSVSVSETPRAGMVMYLICTQETPEFLEVCGCFASTEGKVLVELKGVRVAFVNGGSKDPRQSLFFHNELIPLPAQTRLNRKIKALVFADKLGIATALEPYMHPESTTVDGREKWTFDQLRALVSQSPHLREVLFIRGAENLSHLSSERTLEHLVTCCELFRQVLLALRESGSPFTVRVITYRSGGVAVDHISPGFVLSGMTRSCAAEMAGFSFQLIDLSSLDSEDVATLVHVINTCDQQEVVVSRGQASALRVVPTQLEDKASLEADVLSASSPTDSVLQTVDPYGITRLSVAPFHRSENLVLEKSVEVQLTDVCVHSSDYFPVTLSHLNFGKTLYWHKHSSHSHTLLALDFGGVVTAVGKDVRHLRVGDHVASCYPVAATSRVIIPDSVCYSTKRFPFLKAYPCMSYFILAWEILEKTLPKVEQKKMAIISSDAASALVKVLALTANRSGWHVSCLPHFRGEPPGVCPCRALVFLPPFDPSWQETHDHDGHERDAVFVCGAQESSSLSFRSELVREHTLDVTRVLQKAKLKAQSKDLSGWLLSLGFGTESLPLRKETFQTSVPGGPQTDAESYFTSRSVRVVVLEQPESEGPVSDVPLLTKSDQLFKTNGVYIVTGGLTGLGLETVKFIARSGGGCIVTLSRRVPTEEMQLEMELVRKRYGVVVKNLQCDVSVSRQVAEAVSVVEENFSCPIKGVFHSAAVLHDALIDNLDESLFRKVLLPKVSGALNLHYATLNKKLDFFVCYSSVSSFVGNASQCNYAAANSFLDTFCHYRRNLGLSGQSINWGPLNLGLLFNKDHFWKFLEARGMMIMDVGEFHQALDACLRMNRPQQVICKFNFKNLNVHVLSQNTSLRERLSALVETELRDAVCEESLVQHSASTRERVRVIVSDMCSVSVDELDDDVGLCALGIDSMSAMTLQNKIYQETGVNVPLVRILDPQTTPATLVTFVIKDVL